MKEAGRKFYVSSLFILFLKNPYMNFRMWRVPEMGLKVSKNQRPEEKIFSSRGKYFFLGTYGFFLRHVFIKA